jgi:UDP-GlcNAc:undecaprenyl-phosphate/decaprenyl-phosphate GlcNAc-1-phosphate transferase
VAFIIHHLSFIIPEFLLMLWLILGCMIPSMVVCWAAAFAVRRWGPSFGLVDRPGHRKIHQKPMPTSGGLAIWLGIVLPLAAGQIVLWELGTARYTDNIGGKAEGSGFRVQGSATENNVASSPEPRTLNPEPFIKLIARHTPGILHQSARLWELLAGGTVLMLLGLADDRRGLDWRLRIGVQTLVAVVLVCSGWRMSLFIDLPLLTGAISVLWIVGLVNSFNMLDNMDGLSAGVAAIVAIMFAAVMLTTPRPDNNQPQLFVAGFLLVIAGSLLGFLWHNRPPARLFMGDAGSYLVGYLLAMTTLTATFAGGNLPKHAILAPLCVLAVPLYDTASVVLIRLRSGRSPFVGDKSHFSHRLVELGLSKPKAVLTIYLATATCGLGALLLHQVSPSGAIVVFLMVLCILALVAILETVGRRKP